MSSNDCREPQDAQSTRELTKTRIQNLLWAASMTTAIVNLICESALRPWLMFIGWDLNLPDGASDFVVYLGLALPLCTGLLLAAKRMPSQRIGALILAGAVLLQFQAFDYLEESYLFRECVRHSGRAFASEDPTTGKMVCRDPAKVWPGTLFTKFLFY